MTRRLKIIALVAVLTLSVAGIAAASEAAGEEALDEALGEEEELVDSWFWYDAELMQLIYALPDPESAETPDCVVPDAGDPDATAESTVAEEPPAELPEGCRVVDVVGPSGKVTHGSIVSAFVHSLKEDYDKAIHGPKGQWVREVAWSDDGKTWSDDDGFESDEAGGETVESRGNGKNKKPKKDKGRNR